MRRGFDSFAEVVLGVNGCSAMSNACGIGPRCPRMQELPRNAPAAQGPQRSRDRPSSGGSIHHRAGRVRGPRSGAGILPGVDLAIGIDKMYGVNGTSTYLETAWSSWHA